MARGDLDHDVVLTRPRRTLLKSRTLQSQPRLRGDVKVAASQKSSLRSREKSLLLSKLLQASLAAGASNSATERDPRLMRRIAHCHRSRLSLRIKVASVTTAIDVAQNRKLMSRVDVRLHLLSLRTTTAGGSSRQPTTTTWVARCLATTTVGIEGRTLILPR